MRQRRPRARAGGARRRRAAPPHLGGPLPAYHEPEAEGSSILQGSSARIAGGVRRRSAAHPHHRGAAPRTSTCRPRAGSRGLFHPSSARLVARIRREYWAAQSRHSRDGKTLMGSSKDRYGAGGCAVRRLASKEPSCRAAERRTARDRGDATSSHRKLFFPVRSARIE